MNKANGQVFQYSNGTWRFRVQWRDGGARRSRSGAGFATAKEARAAMHKVLGEVSQGLVTATPAGTVGEYLEEWLDTYTRSGKIKRSTAAKCADHVHSHLIPRIGHIRLAKLTPAHVARLYADLLSAGEARHMSGRGLSPKSVRNIHGTLNKALGDAVKFGRLPRNVAAVVDLPRYQPRDIEAWNEHELADFLGTAIARGDYLFPIWYLMASTPLRRGEVAGLRWRDVDLVEGLVHIRSTRVDVRGNVFEESPKSARSRRTVPLDGEAVVALARLRNAQEAAAKALKCAPFELVLTDLDGEPIKPEAFSRRFAAAARHAKVKPIRLHSLRHTYASRALHAGVSIHVVSAMLGHADAGFTLRTYSPFMPHQGREAAEMLGGRLTSLIRQNGAVEGGANGGANLEPVLEEVHAETGENRAK